MPYFQHNDVNLFYTDQGTGTPVLLLHGYACSSHDWSFQIPFLLSLNYRVIAVDQRGHGNSSTPPTPESYKLSEFANDAVALLKHLETGPAVVVGHSMGTIIASIVAAEYPESVKALVLTHPIYSGVPDALPKLAQAMRDTPEKSQDLAVGFFTALMYTPRTPEWLKTWQVRRVLGMDTAPLIGCLEGVVGVFGSVMGQGDEARAFMRKRKGPRLVVCTFEASPGWEREIGLDDSVDEVCSMTEATFSHMVESEKFNKTLGDWLQARGL